MKKILYQRYYANFHGQYISLPENMESGQFSSIPIDLKNQDRSNDNKEDKEFFPNMDYYTLPTDPTNTMGTINLHSTSMQSADLVLPNIDSNIPKENHQVLSTPGNNPIPGAPQSTPLIRDWSNPSNIQLDSTIPQSQAPVVRTTIGVQTEKVIDYWVPRSPKPTCEVTPMIRTPSTNEENSDEEDMILVREEFPQEEIITID